MMQVVISRACKRVKRDSELSAWAARHLPGGPRTCAEERLGHSPFGLLHLNYYLLGASHASEVGTTGVGIVGTCINIHLWELVTR